MCVSSGGEDKGYCDGVTPDSKMCLAVMRESVSECHPIIPVLYVLLFKNECSVEVVRYVCEVTEHS